MFVSRGAVHQHVTDRGNNAVVASSVCLVIAVFGILIRCTARKWIVRTFALDDWLMIICFAIYAVLVAIVIKMADLGLGKHSNDLDAYAMSRLFKYIYVAEIFYNTVTVLIKLAFTLFYLRILPEIMIYGYPERTLQYAKRSLWALIVFILCFGVTLECLFIFQCTPVSHMWTIFLGSKGFCLSQKTLVAVTYLHSAINGTLDVLLAIFPVPFLWKMDLKLGMKMSIIGILTVGALASVATFIRFKFIKGLPQAGSTDPLWGFEPLVVWSVVEPGLALLAAGLVVSKPLVHSISRVLKRRNPHDLDLVVSVDKKEVR